MRFLVFLFLLSFVASSRGQNGLTGQYYDTATFGTLSTTRTDATVNFDWGSAIPAGTAITNADSFSVAWTGQIEPEFSQLYTFYVTADDGARLWVNDQLLVQRTFYANPTEMRGQVALKAGQRVNIRLEYIEQSGNAAVKLEWSSGSRAREVIPSGRLFPARVAKAGGALLKEHWSGIAGGTIAALTSHANYPAKPGGREFITSFESLAQNWSDAYGTRITGYIVPPTTGNYTFAVSGDDVAELHLSTDATPANKALIASVSAATGFRVWNAQPSQQSAPRLLVQGQRYYVELLHKESTGSDHWSVGWMRPGDATLGVVPGSALVQPGLATAQPAQAALLDTMAQEHPRIFATAERFAKLRATWQNAATSQPKTWAQNAINSANALLTEPAITYAPDVRGTILGDARKVVDRMYKLGLAWQLTGDSQYAERAWTELSAVAAFPDWHPSHFLDTAEMTHGCAIGYDWFYHYWTQARRDTIRNAIINMGLNPGLTQFTSNVGWSRPTGNNWNMVCTGGLSIGALAVGTESEALVENILNRSLNSTRPVWAHFTTDCGGWYEGPGYWGYTMEYGIRMLAALEWVLGSDYGISSTQGVSESGFAPIESTGTTNIMFNFADAGAGGPTRGPVFQWMARRYGQPLFDWWENQGGGGALDALWYNESAASLLASATPPDMAFHGDAGTAFQPQEMVTMRGKWNDSRATFLGSKGGHMGADHGNLDAGTFVLDALGKRWFHDLGGDNYALPGYFSSSPSTGTDRWDYYRMRPEGQNTLTINPSGNADMVLGAVAPLLGYQSEAGGRGSFAIHDLTPAYSGMMRVWRGTRLTGVRDEVILQDEIQAASGKSVWWFAHFTNPTTTVAIDPDGTSALMTQGAERLWCKIVRGGGTFQIMDAVPLPTSPNPANQNANAGYKKLAINLANVTNTTLAVWFVPLSSGEAIPATLPAITPLNTWNLAADNDAPIANAGGATGSGENAVDIDLRGYVTDDSTPAEQMRFSVSDSVNGTVTLLADGFTARFTPTPGYTGAPTFNFTATDTAPDPRLLLAYDFDLPDANNATTVPDVSGNLRDGTIDYAGSGSFQIVADQHSALISQGARSVDLTETVANAARVKRSVSAAERNWNSDNWTAVGWLKRRDTESDDFVWHIGAGDGFGTTNEIYVNCPTGSSTVRLQHHNGTIFDIDITRTGIQVGAWHHFAVVREGTTIFFYVNGELAGSDNSFTFALDQNSPLVFGGHADASFQPVRWFDGRLDELAVFTAALPPSEVAALAGGRTLRHFGGLSSTGTITLWTTPVTFIWNNTTSGNVLPWSTGGNWSGGSAPTGNRGTTLQFFMGQTLTGGTVTANRDGTGEFVLNSLTLAGTTNAATTAMITGGALTLLNNGLQNPSVTLNATNGSGFVYDVATPITLGAPTTFSGTGNATVRFSGAIGGAGDLVKTSSGTLVLNGSNTYTGDTLISSGTLQIGADGATGALGTGDVVNNATLRFDRTGILDVPNSIAGTGGVTVDCPIGAGTIVLSGTNSFDGNVTVSSGSLRITNSFALGDGIKTVGLTNGTLGAPQLRLDGTLDNIELPATISFNTSSASGALINETGNNVVSGNITLTGGGGDTRITVLAGTLTLDGTIAPNTTLRTLQLAGAGVGLINGTIRNGGSSYQLNVSKYDAGIWTLSGANAHAGTTTINAGTLVLAHPNGLGHGGTSVIAPVTSTITGSTSIASGGTLDLNGQIGINEVLTIRGTGVGGLGSLVNNASSPASVLGGVVSSLAITAGGTHSSVPIISLTGTGSGASATATLGVTAASFTIAGGSTIYSAAPNVAISGGGGTGATATAVLSGGVVSGITITNAGTGYTSAPTISFSGGTITTAGTNPTGTGNAENFIVAGLTVTDPGAGYTSAPAVTFQSGTGTAATANLSAIVLGTNATVGGSGDLAIDALVSGGFALTKVGEGVLTLSAANTYTGATTINAGKLALAGSLTSNITTNAAVFVPRGAPSTTGSLTMAAAATFQARLNNSAPGTGFDQMNVGGNISLNGTLELITGPNLAPGSTFTILNNTGAGMVSGTFAGRANNSTFLSGGYQWRINYNGGTGNDVVLTLITTALENWRYAYFGTVFSTGDADNFADLDFDGLGNLLEYGLSGDPTLASTATLPQTTTVNGKLALTFTRTLSHNDITLIVQGADSVSGPWTDLASSVSGAAMTPLVGGVTATEAGSGATRAVTVSDQFLRTDPAHPRRFLRVLVRKP